MPLLFASAFVGRLPRLSGGNHFASWLGNRAPIILSERGYVGIGLAAQQRRRTDAIREIGVAIIAQLLRSDRRSEEHTSELQSLMRISYAVFCLKKKNTNNITTLIH